MDYVFIELFNFELDKIRRPNSHSIINNGIVITWQGHFSNLIRALKQVHKKFKKTSMFTHIPHVYCLVQERTRKIQRSRTTQKST